MSEADFDLMVAHLSEPRQVRHRGRGTLAVTLFFSCVVANGVKCTTLADLAAVTAWLGGAR